MPLSFGAYQADLYPCVAVGRESSVEHAPLSLALTRMISTCVSPWAVKAVLNTHPLPWRLPGRSLSACCRGLWKQRWTRTPFLGTYRVDLYLHVAVGCESSVEHAPLSLVLTRLISTCVSPWAVKAVLNTNRRRRCTDPTRMRCVG